MDLLKIIQTKVDYLSKSGDERGISSVVSHIEIAERHFENGRSGDEYLFNDVIYRSNQAFEGSLKEAYRVVSGKSPNKLTTYKIEKFFEENDVLKERVLQLFTNYRTEWRNESTHDHELYFSEQEAFLAIVNISAFVNILLDQMIEKQAYDQEVEDLKKSSVKRKTKSSGKTLHDRIVDLLLSFSKEVPQRVSGATIPRITESALIGSFAAFVDSLAEDISVYQDFRIVGSEGDRRYIADFLFQKDHEKLVVEVKNPGYGISRVLSDGTDQLFNYLAAAGVGEGVLYIPPLVEEELQVVEIIEEVGDSSLKVTQIYPEKRLNK